MSILSNSIMRVTPRKLTWMVAKVLSAGLVPFVVGSPGSGKSAIIKQLAAAGNLKVIDHRLSTSEPTDLSGLPHFVNGKAEFAPFAGLFPIENITDVPDGYSGWLLFLDEFNSANRDVQKAAYKLILDRQLGQYNLHPSVNIVCAGNLLSDRAIVSDMSTAMQSRMVHLELVVEHKDWLLDVGIPQDYDKRIIGFLSRFPDKLMAFDPNHSDKTFACPRTWEFVDRLLKVCDEPNKISEDLTPLFAGAIGAGMATEFIQFTAVYERLPTVSSIVAGTTQVPNELNLRWAVISMLSTHVAKDEKDLAKIIAYVNEFESSMRVLFYRMSLARNADLRRVPEFADGLVSLAQFF